MPLAVELALGTFAMEQRPLPARWAYSWAACSPYAHLSTVERRCPEEFAEYFAFQYHRTFGEGILLPDRNYGSALTYRPLSPSFQRPLQVGPRGVPSIGSVTYGYSELTDLVRNVSTELEPFARAVVAGSATTPLSAYGLLPDGMNTMEASPRVTPLKTALDGALQQKQSVLVEKASLLSFFPEAGSVPTPTQATGISRLFERLGYGIEPNPTTMKTPFLRAEHVGLYRYEFGPDNYYEERDLSEQLALLSIWSYIAAADGPIQASTGASVCSLLVGLSDLQPFEVNRLHAHAAWLAAHPASLGDARRRFGPPDDWEIDKTAFVIASMAHIDVTLTPARIKATTKVYGMLGLTSERLHADLHRISTERTPPTQIIQGEAVAGYGIPAAPSPGEVLLDPNRIAAVRLQTDSISSVLHDVFAENNLSSTESPAPRRAGHCRCPVSPVACAAWSAAKLVDVRNRLPGRTRRVDGSRSDRNPQ